MNRDQLREQAAAILWSHRGFYAAWDDAKECRKHQKEVAECYLHTDRVLSLVLPDVRDAQEGDGWHTEVNRWRVVVCPTCNYMAREYDTGTIICTKCFVPSRATLSPTREP